MKKWVLFLSVSLLWAAGCSDGGKSFPEVGYEKGVEFSTMSFSQAQDEARALKKNMMSDFFHDG
jgi:hypothetical protein